MSQYLILIYGEVAAGERMLVERDPEIMAGHAEFARRNGSAIRGGEALQPVSTATSVRRDDDGGFVITDGPFAETKEALGGYYVVEAADIDAAIELAKQIPTSGGGLEVRPIMVLS